jgi:hypothetical protein
MNTPEISPALPPRDGEGQPAAGKPLPPPGNGGGRLDLRREGRQAPRGGLDFFVTPPEATRALIARESFSGHIWECACGDGAMVRPLLDAGYVVMATDIAGRGCGLGDIDFLSTTRLPACIESIVTNPPYGEQRAEAFARHALDLGARKVALLLRLAFLEGEGRHRSLFSERPPSRVWVFSHRITLWRGDQASPEPGERRGRGATPFAWFVWERFHRGTQIDWIYRPSES